MELIRVGDAIINMDMVTFIEHQEGGLTVHFPNNVLSLDFKSHAGESLQKWLEVNARHAVRPIDPDIGF